MAAPFYRVIIQENNRDITDLIESFRFEDCVDKTDLVELSIKSDNPNIVDDPDLQGGKKIIYSFGYRHRQSGKKLAKIEDVEPNFASTVRITVRAFDLGLAMKKEERSDIWEDIKASDIAKQIAERNGLKHNIVPTETIYKSIPQGGKTDYDFLLYLAKIEADGSFRFFVKDDVLNFNRINLKQESQKTFRYKDPDGVVLSFIPRSGGSTKDKASRSTSVSGIDPLTGKEFEKIVDNSNSVDDTKLGDYPAYYNSNAEELSPSQSAKKSENPTVGKNIVSPSMSEAEAINIANKKKKEASLEDITASLTTEGDPFNRSDTIITMANVGRKFSGNWYVSNIVHVISKGRIYSNGWELKKNASKTNISKSEKASDQNNSVGPDENKSEKTVKTFVYNANGEPV